jgi:HAD superfamily hydrolase (TIGR01549 family)
VRALLLDFGGVLVDGGSRPGWPARLATVLGALLAQRGAPVPDALGGDLTAAVQAYAWWGDAMCRRWAPAELSHAEFWSDFVAADWPATARAVVVEHATELCHRLGRLRHDWTLRPGVPQLLADVAARGIPVAVVSNTLYGAVHREFLAGAGLADRFAAQLYSDEAGVRKPNPELLVRAANAVGVAVGAAWYVGDTWSRDVLCGRRAGVGRTVLMRSLRTDTDVASRRAAPDLVVPDPAGLRVHLP